MSDSVVNIEDYICSVCREIFDHPVSLPCSHTFCHKCCFMLKKTTANHQQYHCAICREVASSFHRNRDLDQKLSTLKAPCQYCSKLLILKELRKHTETCISQSAAKPPSRPIILTKTLSESQQKALELAQAGANRSTFTCPFCQKSNLTCTHLRHHIKKHHKQEDQQRVCPICSSMPWGDKTMVSSNVYQHIKRRHQFDYDTFVNYAQNEQQMINDAIQASLKESS